MRFYVQFPVYAPADAIERAANGNFSVIVYIMGEAFQSGSAHHYGPDFFIEKDVIVVSNVLVMCIVFRVLVRKHDCSSMHQFSHLVWMCSVTLLATHAHTAFDRSHSTIAWERLVSCHWTCRTMRATWAIRIKCLHWNGLTKILNNSEAVERLLCLDMTQVIGSVFIFKSVVVNLKKFNL